MDAERSCKAYVLYIGAGAVAAGGIISMCRAMPLIVSSIRSGLARHAAVRRCGGETKPAAPTAICRCGSSSSARWRWSRCIWIFLGVDPQAGGSWSLAAMFDIG